MTLASALLMLVISAAVVTYSAAKLAEYGDIIAVRTKLGGLFIGSILLAGATSLPEFLASINAFRIGEPNLAAGNFFGSNVTNIALLALVDLGNRNAQLLRRVAISHSLTAALATVLMLVAAISMFAETDQAIGWVGIDSLLIIGLYLGGMFVIQRENKTADGPAETTMEPADDFPSLKKGLLGFGAAALVLAFAVPYLVRSTTELATITGLSTGFVGTVLLSLLTSLPEFISSFFAVRMGSLDLAVGNILGSNAFNMFGLAVSDFFLTDGPFLHVISPDFILVALFALLLTNMALVGNLARVERKFWFFTVDSIAILVVYVLAFFLLYQLGIGV